ncbi:MAG: serine/threonine-protein phosphatase [Ignavibacteriales bacterium]|nr:serine/threonine-protein phosphatase [Ignavibacteriales bacterium]MBK7979716.1 serine/threonine-protein phosphatase [Ignavibacteriota bacterium]
MEQKRLFKTIDALASKHFESESELLHEVLKQLIENTDINISGGRIWILNVEEKAYYLMHQMGKVQRIKKDFKLTLNENPILSVVTKYRTILANETNEVLLKKGIFKYSASGIGLKKKIGENYYYEYLLAVNSDDIKDELRYILNIVATVLTSKIRERRLSSSRKNLIADLDKAKQLQRSILPEHEYKYHGYDIFGVTIPAEIVGGDFYDYIKIGDDEERLGIVVGDAASKGFSASAEAMYISGAIRMAGNFQIKISPMMNRMNKLVNKIFSDDRFSSLFYGELSNDKKGLFLYANAGHNPPMFYSSKTSKISFLEPTGPLLGPAPNSKYETDSLNFDSGDILVIYSDGITEAANNAYEFYEENRLANLIITNKTKTPKQLAALIIDDVQKFSTADSKYQDDKTIVVIKRN